MQALELHHRALTKAVFNIKRTQLAFGREAYAHFLELTAFLLGAGQHPFQTITGRLATQTKVGLQGLQIGGRRQDGGRSSTQRLGLCALCHLIQIRVIKPHGLAIGNN